MTTTRHTLAALTLIGTAQARGVCLKAKHQARLTNRAVRRDLAVIRDEIESAKPETQRNWDELDFSVTRNMKLTNGRRALNAAFGAEAEFKDYSVPGKRGQKQRILRT